ncbi:MAG: hypothetical protein AAF703_10110 [Cyanobacteria bacterium P01_D01_bin.105]
MKLQSFLNLTASVVTAIALTTGSTLQASAQEVQSTDPTAATSAAVPSSPNTSQPILSPLVEAARAQRDRNIPASTGVVVTFLAPIAIDVNEAAYPMTLPLTSPIHDSLGNVVAPENSPVSVMIQPGDDGARVVAQSVLINGRITPIQAASPLIPGTTITHMRANDRAADDGATLGRMAASGFGFLNGGDPDAFDRGGMLGNLVGMVAGRRDETSRVVQIPQGSVFVLPLEQSVQIGQ